MTMGNPTREIKGKFTYRMCPKCEKYYNEPSALSRVDNKTKICPQCGVKEALEAAADSMGMELS